MSDRRFRHRQFRFSSGIAVTSSEIPLPPPVVCLAIIVVGALCPFVVTPRCTRAMNCFGTLLIASASLLNGLAADEAKPVPATPAVVITSDYIRQLVAEARTNNPSLKAADSRMRAATLNAQAVRSWEDPMAMVGGSVYGSRGFAPSEDGNLAYGIEQKLPLWGRPKLTRRVAEAATSLRHAEVNDRAAQLRVEVTKTLLQAALAQRVVDLGEQDLAWIEATAKATDDKYRAGQSLIADTLQLQNEVAKRHDTLRTDRLRLVHE